MSLARGDWKATDKNFSKKLLGIIKEASSLGEAAGQSVELPGISREEEHAARMLLNLFSYCHAKEIDLGKALMLVHAKDAMKKIYSPIPMDLPQRR